MSKKETAVAATPEEIALADISRQQFNRYQKVLAPFEDEFLRESRITEGEKQQMHGTINADVKQAVATEYPGVTPAGGRNVQTAARDLAVGETKAMSSAQAAGNMRAENADVKAIMDGIQMGRGQAIEAVSGLGTEAAYSTDKAIRDAFGDQQERNDNAELIGSAMGTIAYGAGKITAPTTAKTDASGIPLDAYGNYQFDP